MGSLFEVSDTTGNVNTPLVQGRADKLTLQPLFGSGEGVYIKDSTGATVATFKSGVATLAATSTTGNITITNPNGIVFNDTEGSPKFVTVEAPTTITSSYTLKWPVAQSVGTQVLANDGSGNLSWESVPTTPVTVSNGGTGDTTLTTHAVLLGEGTSAVAFATPGTSGLVLTSAGVSSDPEFKPSGIGNIITTATSGTITPDASTGNTFYTAVSNTVTYDGPTNGVDGQKVTFRILNDATHSVTFATTAGNFRFGTDISSYTNSVSKTDYVGVIWNSAANFWDIVSIIQGF